MKKIEHKKRCDILPKQYNFCHQYCYFLHDLLTDIIVSGERDGIFKVSFELRDKKEQEEFSKRTGEELWIWLENNGYEDIVYHIYYRQICVALLSDLCHFVYEALNCSSKCKLTVTYALLRKPFKENLFYLEWLLADPKDFIKKFHFNDIENLAISGSKFITQKKKKEIIKKAINKTKHGHWIDPEFIYQLRYDKKVHYGMEQMWQKANHLITTFKFLETEERNFNFVFSDDTAHKSQWDCLYSFLPILLFHTLEIVQALIATFAKIKDEEEHNITEFRKELGFLLWVEKRPKTIKMDNSLEKIAKSVEEAQLRCPKCKKKLDYKKQDLKLIYEKAAFKCRKCQFKWSVYPGEPRELT